MCSAVACVVVHGGYDPARALDGLPVRCLFPLEALEQPVEDGADLGHVPLEDSRGRLLAEALLEHKAEVVWDLEQVAVVVLWLVPGRKVIVLKIAHLMSMW